MLLISQWGKKQTNKQTNKKKQPQGVRREFFRDSLQHLVINSLLFVVVGLPRWLSDKEFTYQAGDAGLIPRSGSPGGGNIFQDSFLGNTKDRGAGWATQSMRSQRDTI